MNNKFELNKGIIKDSALKATLKSKLFKPRVESKLKGKGSFNRKSRKLNKNHHNIDGFLVFEY